jgi:AraC-like DNA-binding protein
MRLFNAAIQVTNAWPDAPSRADAARGLEQQLVAALVECLSAGPNATARQRYLDIMDRLESCLRDRPNGFPSVAELSVTLGVSARTLRRWCKAQLGMTANRYLRLRQMQRIRHALHNADHFGATVSELTRR